MDGEFELVGRSRVIRDLEEEARRAAASMAKVLITGESGVGKEVFARLIHRHSEVGSEPLIAVNCAGVPETLLESELFGHVRGSFTGAYRDKRGLLHLAAGGAIFLDEVGEMSPRMQALLLRFLETGEVQRVGGDTPSERIKLRVICATNRDLYQQVQANQFRADLYYRLNVIHLVVPPLRERPEDVAILIDHFLTRYLTTYQRQALSLAPEVRDRLLRYSWPGNVRELKHLIESLVVRVRRDVIELADLPARVLAASVEPSTASGAPIRSTRAQELMDRMLTGGESFWTCVHQPFLKRDLTRDDIRCIVQSGLEMTRGNYKVLTELFRLPASDYRRFLNFLRKYDCQQPFRNFRSVRLESHPQTARGELSRHVG